VGTFGAVLALLGLAGGAFALARRVRHQGARALSGLGIATGVLVGLAGVGLAAFPRADHVWLDGVERLVPAVQTAFLTPSERHVAEDSRAAIARGRAELHRLRGIHTDVQWGLRELGAEQQERLRQFMVGRDELIAGDQLVLRTLRDKARNRQRFSVGLPMALAGAGGALLAYRRYARRPVSEIRSW
jgi:zinc/manganese transport system permease protein